jgi:hypothetical protein
MFQRKGFLLATLVLSSSIAFGDNMPRTQNWVQSWLSRFSPVSTGLQPKTIPIWRSFCQPGQNLTDLNGCTPDCNNPRLAPTCYMLFNIAQTEELTSIPLPYLSNGIVIFELPQHDITSSAIFNVVLGQTPRNYGYMCQILNENATPAFLWDTTTKAFTNIITLDFHTNKPPFKSNNFVNTVAQGTDGFGYWYTNPNNHLHMMCLGYQAVSGTNNLQSNPACGGNTGECVSYTLQ